MQVQTRAIRKDDYLDLRREKGRGMRGRGRL
jgi:hypothetical protein